jgi:uncharacterized protein YdcH (DUF465 family)
METDFRELKEVLRKENDEFRLLMESHATCEARLRELQKLLLKDKMEALMQNYRNGDLTASGSR